MLQLDSNKKVPLYEQLFRELRERILAGEYGTDYRLKPIRILAQELSVSHNTINRAYQQLLAEGYIRATQGSGFYVEELYSLEEIRKRPRESGEGRNGQTAAKAEVKYDFSRNSMENEAFPWNKWSRYLQEAILEERYGRQISEGENKGDIRLREGICDYVNRTRGVGCAPEQIVICPTTEHAMEIVTNVLPEREYVVGVEEPGSEKMRRIFISRGCAIRPIPLTGQGMDANALEHSDCSLLYVTPSCQFPTGATLPLIKRLQILEWCRRNGAYCIENDYENEFLYGEAPILSLQSLDRNGIVIYVSSFSDVLTPEIKCAFVILPPKLLEHYEERYYYFRPAMPHYEQRALARFIEDGHLERQSRRVAVANRRKKEIFLRFAREKLKGQIRCFAGALGSHFLIEIFRCGDARAMADRFLSHGIRIYPTEEYWYDQSQAPRNIFMMSFGAIPEKEMMGACESFAKVLGETSPETVPQK